MQTHPFVVLEGADAVGKSTVARELAKLMGANIVKTPGQAFDALRKQAEEIGVLGRFQFYCVSVAMSLPRIRHLLESGPVICDRYIQATIAFHAALGVEIPDNLPEKLNLLEPTLTVHLTVKLSEAARRISETRDGSEPDAAIENDTELQAKVVKNYQCLEDFGLTGKYIPVEIATDGRTPNEVAREIFNLL